jgi:hypothetical protein
LATVPKDWKAEKVLTGSKVTQVDKGQKAVKKRRKSVEAVKKQS